MWVYTGGSGSGLAKGAGVVIMCGSVVVPVVMENLELPTVIVSSYQVELHAVYAGWLGWWIISMTGHVYVVYDSQSVLVCLQGCRIVYMKS